MKRTSKKEPSLVRLAAASLLLAISYQEPIRDQFDPPVETKAKVIHILPPFTRINLDHYSPLFHSSVINFDDIAASQCRIMLKTSSDKQKVEFIDFPGIPDLISFSSKVESFQLWKMRIFESLPPIDEHQKNIVLLVKLEGKEEPILVFNDDKRLKMEQKEFYDAIFFEGNLLLNKKDFRFGIIGEMPLWKHKRIGTASEEFKIIDIGQLLGNGAGMGGELMINSKMFLRMGAEQQFYRLSAKMSMFTHDEFACNLIIVAKNIYKFKPTEAAKPETKEFLSKFMELHLLDNELYLKAGNIALWNNKTSKHSVNSRIFLRN